MVKRICVNRCKQGAGVEVVVRVVVWKGGLYEVRIGAGVVYRGGLVGP